MAYAYFYSFCAIIFSGILFSNGGNCPSTYFRCGSQCYYLSNETVAWQDAYFECKSRKGSLAKPDTRSQDKSLRACLQKDFIPRTEKWIDGQYDWQQKRWIWSSSSESMTYQMFSGVSPNEFLQWTCAVLNPKLSHKWSIRNCIEKKLYLCQVPLYKQ